MTSIQLGGQKQDDDVFYMPINSPSTININMASIPAPKPPREKTKVRPALSSLGSMSSTTTSPPSTPSSPDKLHMKQLKLSDADSAVGSWHEGSSYHSNDSDVIAGSPRNGAKDSEEIPFSSRVALYRRDNIHVALKITCQTEAICNDSRVLSLLTELTDLTVKHFRDENCDKLTMTTPQVCKLRLKDGRLAQEQLSELGRTLGQSLTVSSAVCRRTPEHGYVGIFVDNIIEKKPFLTISSQGVMLVLHKTNRYAPVEEFSGQVCEHITKKKPTEMGDPKNIWELLLKKAKFGHAHLPKDQLLAQTFLFDPTLTILEAAKKCFVEIRDFALLN